MKRYVPTVKIRKIYSDHTTTVRVHALKYAKLSGTDGTSTAPEVPETSDTLLVDKQVPEHAEETEQFEQTNISKYHFYREKALNEWAAVREDILRVQLENACPSSFTCTSCGTEQENIIRCPDCGPQMYLCIQCAVECHQLMPFHLMQQWNGLAFETYTRPNLPVLSAVHPPTSHCVNRLQKILVFDNQGRQHDVLVRLCSCESPILTLLRSDLWAANAERPQVAYSMVLLTTLESLLLECHVSVKGFCEALAMRYHFSKSQTRHLYRLLVNESFEEFRHARFRLRTFRPKSEPAVKKQCPLCPLNNQIISIDANFGLVHKKSAGVSLEPPKHGDRMFVPTAEVDLYTQDNGMKDSTQDDKSCNNFQAGNKIRAKNRSLKLDVTAVFGSVCRHEFPVRFLDMKHGERLVYPELLIRSIMDTAGAQSLHVTYDIACLFKKYLQKSEEGRTLLGNLTLAIPIFHCYGHQLSCQVNYSPRRVAGFANVDGEAIERLWSYLRGFTNITKEMTPTHRTDLLTDALLYYGEKKMFNLGNWLVGRLSDSKKQLTVCAETVANISKEYHTKISQEDIENWKIEEKQLPLSSKKPEQTWEETYVADLEQAATVRVEASNSSDLTLKATLDLQVKEIEKKIQRIEKLRKVSTRWKSSEPKFCRAKSSLLVKKQESLLQKLQCLSHERTFLLALKKKYAVGQAIAVRICRQHKKTNKKINTTVKALNNLGFLYNGLPLEENASLDPASEMFMSSAHQTVDGLPWSVRREVLDMHYRQICLAEEVTLCEQEMVQLCQWTVSEHSRLCTHLAPIQRGQTLMEIGQRAVLSKHCKVLEAKYLEYLQQFSSHVRSLPTMEVAPQPTDPGNDWTFDHDVDISEEAIDLYMEQFTIHSDDDGYI